MGQLGRPRYIYPVIAQLFYLRNALTNWKSKEPPKLIILIASIKPIFAVEFKQNGNRNGIETPWRTVIISATVRPACE